MFTLLVQYLVETALTTTTAAGLLGYVSIIDQVLSEQLETFFLDHPRDENILATQCYHHHASRWVWCSQGND